MSTACPKCNYLRQPVETVPDWQCPKCGVAYNKVGAAANASVTASASRSATRSPARAAVVDADELQPIKSAPSLFTLNGFGFMLYGRGDVDADNDSYMTTHYLVFLFIPVAPLARYRVIRDGNRYMFLGKGRLRTFDKVHLAIAALMVLLFAVSARSH